MSSEPPALLSEAARLELSVKSCLKSTEEGGPAHRCLAADRYLGMSQKLPQAAVPTNSHHASQVSWDKTGLV